MSAALTLLYVAACEPAVADTVVASAGKVAVSGGVCLSYTVGETAVGFGANAQTMLAQGFQHASSYDFFSAQLGLTSGPMADADQDGISNLLEFAFGTNPLSAASRTEPVASIGPGGKLYITIAKGSLAGDLIWTAEVSNDLVHWTTQNVNIVLNNSVFSALYTGNAPAFMRLRVSLTSSK